MSLGIQDFVHRTVESTKINFAGILLYFRETFSSRTVPVLNTAAVKLKDKDWALTSLADLCAAHLLPDPRVDGQTQLTTEEYPILSWNHKGASHRLSLDVRGYLSGAGSARSILDYVHKKQRAKQFISLRGRFEYINNLGNDNANGFKNFLAFIAALEPLYTDLSGISYDDIEVVHILMFDTTFGVAWEDGEAREDNRIKLTSAETFDFPLSLVKDGGGVGEVSRKLGFEFTMCTALCIVEVLTEIFVTNKAKNEGKTTEKICVSGILFTHKGASLEAALISDTRQGLPGPFSQRTNICFRMKYFYRNKLLSRLLEQVGQGIYRALWMFDNIKVDGDAAKGKIARWRQWFSWIYVVSVVILAILAVALNWKGTDSVWERVFGGIEFATFGLVGVFGLVKLAGEDQNVIRNTFLGWVRLRTEDDVCRYTGTRNLPLALALYEKSAQWLNGSYTCYALGRTYGGISILSGLDMKSARMAGIYPISRSVAVDLRTGKLRKIERGDGPESHVFRLGSPISPDTVEVITGDPLTEGIFRGPS